MKALYELKEKFEMELEELARKGELGAGDLELAHKPDEYVPCEDILRCEEVLTQLAKDLLF